MKHHCKGPVVIIGAGPTGLGAASALHEAGCDDWVLYDRDDVVGGLARSFRDQHGFTWDVGGHVVFSHYGLFTRLLDDLLWASGWLHHERESWIRALDRWVPYPFQNNIHHLPPEVCARCLEGLISAALNGSGGPFANFDDFISRTFGEGIAEIFMRPYNQKAWAYPPTKLDTGWLGERVSVPNPVRVAHNALLKTDDTAWGPNNRFQFPVTGGTGAIWAALAQQLPTDRVITDCEALELDPGAKRIRLSNGTEQDYGTLISTMPLDCLAAISGRQDWMELASGLMHSAVHVIGIGIKGQAPPAVQTKCWMYFPEANLPFYRLTHFSKYSPNNVDDIGVHWSIMAEVSESPDKPVDASTVAAETLRGLQAIGFIECPEQVTHTWTHRAEYAYPTPSLGRDEIVHRLLPELRELDILSRGRFGAWKYEVGNMDHSFMQGVEAARHLLYGSPELTLWHPDLVNQPHPVLGWERFR